MRKPRLPVLFLLLLSPLGAVVAAEQGGAAVPGAKEPAKVEISVLPESVPAGGSAAVTVRIAPAPGIKINRYPRIKLEVPAQSDLVEAAASSVGNSRPPPSGDLESNYFKTVDPLRLDLRMATTAPAGKHGVKALLSYFYCVAASGFCAPAKVAVTIPVTVR